MRPFSLVKTYGVPHIPLLSFYPILSSCLPPSSLRPSFSLRPPFPLSFLTLSVSILFSTHSPSSSSCFILASSILSSPFLPLLTHSLPSFLHFSLPLPLLLLLLLTTSLTEPERDCKSDFPPEAVYFSSFCRHKGSKTNLGCIFLPSPLNSSPSLLLPLSAPPSFPPLPPPSLQFPLGAPPPFPPPFSSSFSVRPSSSSSARRGEEGHQIFKKQPRRRENGKSLLRH